MTTCVLYVPDAGAAAAAVGLRVSLFGLLSSATAICLIACGIKSTEHRSIDEMPIDGSYNAV